MQAQWEEARDDLGLDLIIPFDIDLGPDVTIHAELLVKNFGCPNGMIVVREYDAIKKSLTQIDELDYGYSVLDWQDPYSCRTSSYLFANSSNSLSDSFSISII